MLFRDGAICQGGFIESLKARHCFRYRLAKGRQLLQIFDVVHIRPQQVLRYLANYTHRVALSNRRMVAIDAQHQTVTFTYRDYRHGSQRKQLTLSALEFIRRFSLHILSSGLVRIRHYGILANNTVQPEKPSSIGRRPGAAAYCANHLLLLIRAQLGGSSNPRAAEVLQSGASLKRR